MINWFNMPDEGLSNGGEFEVKELEVTENGTYEEKGEMYNKVIVNVEGGGGSSDFSTAKMTLISTQEYVDVAFPCIIDDAIWALSRSIEVGTYTVPLYKNKAIFSVIGSYSVSLSGDVVFDDEFNRHIISGDCSITLNPKRP